MVYIIIITLIIASIFDIKSRRIPLTIFWAAFGTRLIQLLVYDRTQLLWMLLYAFLVFGIMMIGVKNGSIGGADSLYALLVGFYLGNTSLYIMTLAFLISLPQAIYFKRKKENPEFPFIPYLLASTILVLVIFNKYGNLI